MATNILEKLKIFVLNRKGKIVISNDTKNIPLSKYKNNIYIKDVVILEGVEKIETSAFSGCTNIKTISLPSSLKEICITAFEDCSNLENIFLPPQIKFIAYGTFNNCTNLKHIRLPYTIKNIESYAFANTRSLNYISLPKKLTNIGVATFYNSALKSIKLPNNLKTIPERAFENCTLLENITLPINLKVIQSKAFYNCPTVPTLPNGLISIGKQAFANNQAKSIIIPSSVTNIEESAFAHSNKLTHITIPEGIKTISSGLLEYSYKLETVSLPSTTIDIKDHAFTACTSLKNINFTRNIKSIGKSAFACCEQLQSINLPKSLNEINSFAFQSCYNLQTVSMHPLSKIGKNIFLDIDFKYLFVNKQTNQLIFSQELIEELDKDPNYDKYSMTEFEKYIYNFDHSQLCKTGNIQIYNQILNTLNKNNFIIPQHFLNTLSESNLLDKIGKDIDFTFFAKELPDFNLKYNTEKTKEYNAKLKFAYSIGCFSPKKIIDKYGTETNILLSQKACGLYANIINNGILTLNINNANNYCFHDLFGTLDISTPPNQSLINFLSVKEKSTYPNINLLLKLENSFPGIFANTINNWSEIEDYRNTINKEGIPVTLSWEKSIIKHYTHKDYINVTQDNIDLARTFASKGISQQFFDEANLIRTRAKDRGIKNNILRTPLKEKTYMESVEEIKNSTKNMLEESLELLQKQYPNFTYEMLDKYDPKNAIIGIYCSCCATITSSFYGKDIAIATMSEDNVQNIVVRDKLNFIIAKGTIYVNKEKGYAVINDFELNRKYRNHEKPGDFTGYYTVDKNDPEEIYREQIFQAFMRGIKDFVYTYNQENPNNHIKQVNVGFGIYNRLKVQCERYRPAIKQLYVPLEYSFRDAAFSQRILYSKKDYAHDFTK